MLIFAFTSLLFSFRKQIYFIDVENIYLMIESFKFSHYSDIVMFLGLKKAGNNVLNVKIHNLLDKKVRLKVSQPSF